MNREGLHSGDSRAAFEAGLDRVLAQIDPGFRERVREDIAVVRAAGAQGLADLESLAGDAGQLPRLRMLCAWLLARLRGAGALPLLARLLGDTDPQLRGEAARSLGLTAAPAAVPLLAGALQADADSEVRFAAAHALGSLADPAGLQPLLDCLGRSGEAANIRGAAVEALALYDDPRATAAALAALQDAAAEVRYWAAFALGEMGDPAAVTPLRACAAADADAEVREEARSAVQAILQRGQRED